MKHLKTIFLLGFFMLIGYGSMGDSGDSGDSVDIVYIDTETSEGKQALGYISLMSYMDMVEKYGNPTYFQDMGSYYAAEFGQISMRKRGTNMWCYPKFRYNASDGSFQSGRWDLLGCKPR